MLHLELWVALRKNRKQLSRILRKIYGVARRVTEDEGGSGPWVFIVDPDPPNPKTPRLRSVLGLKRNEELWVELAFYPSKVRMRNIISRIWQHASVLAAARTLEPLLSKRKPGYLATIAYAKRRAV